MVHRDGVRFSCDSSRRECEQSCAASEWLLCGTCMRCEHFIFLLWTYNFRAGAVLLCWYVVCMLLHGFLLLNCLTNLSCVCAFLRSEANTTVVHCGQPMIALVRPTASPLGGNVTITLIGCTLMSCSCVVCLSLGSLISNH